ncbi:hypothetical protein [Enterococcus canis]|uniref:hypothetical protein n=1 Tax=Enterococcus canis TaxID=214095 RepID=UPI0009002949|nr:hypothetical protein [Enterococcus canis]
MMRNSDEKVYINGLTNREVVLHRAFEIRNESTLGKALHHGLLNAAKPRQKRLLAATGRHPVPLDNAGEYAFLKNDHYFLQIVAASMMNNASQSLPLYL